MYGDAATKSDVDRAVSSAKSDLDYEMRRLSDELRAEIRALDRELDGLRSRVSILEDV